MKFEVFFKSIFEIFAKFEKQSVLKCNQGSLPFTVGIVILGLHIYVYK